MDKTIVTSKFNGFLSGEIIVPPDKSISHRSLIIGSLVKDKIEINNLSLGGDIISTLNILKSAGIKAEFLSNRDLILDSTGGFIQPEKELDCGNSGTSARLLAGLFSSLPFKVKFTGDNSLSKRPMKRIIIPLTKMGADIKSNDNRFPLEITGGNLKEITYCSPVPSAQVKSAILLAGLNATNKTRVYEEYLSRNHTEIMLKYLGASIKTGHDEKGYYAEIEKSKLIPKKIEISGDISSAAFFMVAAAIVPNSKITLKNVNVNPTRTGILKVFEEIGANYKLLNKRTVSGEEVADIYVEYKKDLKPFEIGGGLIPELIDEIPILAVLAATIKGKSIVKDASDLRNKESDRIKKIVEAFDALGINIEENPDGFTIEGGYGVSKSVILETYLDHRLAMSYYVLSLINDKSMTIKDFDCTKTSFPEFLDIMNKIKKED